MTITPSHVEAFLKCPTKCWLRAAGEPPAGNAYAEWVKTQNEFYRVAGTDRLLAEAPKDKFALSPPPQKLKAAKWRIAVDALVQAILPSGPGGTSSASATTAGPRVIRPSGAHDKLPNEMAGTDSTPFREFDGNGANAVLLTTMETRLHAVERVPAEGRGKATRFIPIRFILTNKLSRDDKLLLAFDAFVLSVALGRKIVVGKIIHGDDYATLKVKTSALADEVRKRFDKIGALVSSSAPPDLVLNRHCTECEFQGRCRQKAIEKDDLSLLAGMSEKEREKLHGKGIFTVTQLSYTFRPRRRPKRLCDKREKYHHSLKALAIRENKIHIVGSPELNVGGTPVYLDVEGLPDRDFYYLIGVRIGNGKAAVQHSLWADTIEEEGKIWREFLGILETVEKPVLIHYGSYEATFLKRMCDRYGQAPASLPVMKALKPTLDLLSLIFAQVYFPTYSNSLKDIGYHLGMRWEPSLKSGCETIARRIQWEQMPENAPRQSLLEYNSHDCEALSRLTEELGCILRKACSRPDVDFADSPQRRTSEKGREIHRTLETMLKSAHSAYSRSHIKFLPAADSSVAATGHRARRANLRKRPRAQTRGRVVQVPRRRNCPNNPCHKLRVTCRTAKHTLIDLVFTRSGFHKTLVTYTGRLAYCSTCDIEFVPKTIRGLRSCVFGRAFQAWIVFQRIALRLSYGLIARSMYEVFSEYLPLATMMGFVEKAAHVYRHTEELLLGRILQGGAIHVDETKMNILGTQQYVWVLTDGLHVVFRLRPNRETEFLKDMLEGCAGTLVSDFNGGYDALPCRQQKCLVHLIRDLNDDLWGNPFNEGFEEFVGAVRDLLLPIFDDVQRFGLKTRHLRKHRKRVERFYQATIDDRPDGQELTLRYRKRFQRYRESMFCFLYEDGTPWNNNAAERALRHLALQRKISGAFTKKGAENYLRLLGIAQTCRFQEKSFLGFLLSGLKDLDAYQETRHRRRHRSAATTGTEGGGTDGS